jgi:hypothetical protein
MLSKPITVYLSWAAHDLISDNVPLTEELALRQFDHLLRLRSAGMLFDAYLLDAGWFSRDSGYREWMAPNWPVGGGDRWLEQCRQHGLLPGLWFASNNLTWLSFSDPIPAWEDSINRSRTAMCFFEGGFWPHLLETFGLWYDRGVRVFKIDFTDFDAATPSAEKRFLPSEIRRMNLKSLVTGLQSFRETHPEAIFMGYNGLWETFQHPVTGRPTDIQTGTGWPIRQVFDTRLLDAFDTIYCGDPRPADVPAMNFWRSKDCYSDHMVRVFQANGLPPERIDNAGFMVGGTGTCYFRGAAAWKGMAILAYARGGWLTGLYGDLGILNDDDGRWFAKVQRLFLPFQRAKQITAVGGLPGQREAYGWLAADDDGAVLTIVNPSQEVIRSPWPIAVRRLDQRILFADQGFNPSFEASGIALGPEQMAVIGVGKYASAEYDLGLQADVLIPRESHPVPCDFQNAGPGRIKGTLSPGENDVLRIIVEQVDRDGYPVRSSGGSPPHGTSLAELIGINVVQDGAPLSVDLRYGKVIWSGLSWACVELTTSTASPLEITCWTKEAQPVDLRANIYRVTY